MQSQPPHIPWFGSLEISISYVTTAHRLRSGPIPSKKIVRCVCVIVQPDTLFNQRKEKVVTFF